MIWNVGGISAIVMVSRGHKLARQYCVNSVECVNSLKCVRMTGKCKTTSGFHQPENTVLSDSTKCMTSLMRSKIETVIL